MLERRRRIDPKLELREEEKSKIWKQAFKMYAVFAPFVFIVPILFYSTEMQRDVICQLASYSSR